MKTKQNKTKVYIHTIYGFPATFDGDQIVYGSRVININNGCDTLYQIKKQRKQAIKWRRDKGFFTRESDYGHILIKL